MNILIFEDNFYGNLMPLSLLHPVYDVVTGVYTNRERLEEFLPSKLKLSLHCRNLLLPLMKLENKGKKINRIDKDDYIFVNGSVTFDEGFILWVIKKMKWNSILMNEGKVVVAKVEKEKLTYLKHKIENGNIDNSLTVKDFDYLESFENKEIIEKYSVKIIYYSWDIIKHFDSILEKDLLSLSVNKKRSNLHTKVSAVNLKNIRIAKSANIYPNVVLDADAGMIYIDDKATIEPFSYIKGPVYIGKNVLVKSGAKIFGSCSFGAGCKVTGEISGSIFHSNVNKQHDGFIGNSYACPYVNFGADTVTSNLKNNYSKIRVKFGTEQINTGMQFLGSIIGDHSKFGINTMLNTGTIVGIFANIAGGGFPDKHIDSFSWNILGSQPVKYKIEEAISTAKIVFTRRHIEMPKEYEELVREIYKLV
jgi:UDP-N-acetylglucosamine diphosphorylase / glucose-1-phosphate thymidylyltransferase / UDP-N-acetylgalactosamine diphosphorylase / glucosamine-1-phosphate N-acetyltransferase / galactosamine-1-phosphate N-acetyltransferase